MLPRAAPKEAHHQRAQRRGTRWPTRRRRTKAARRTSLDADWLRVPRPPRGAGADLPGRWPAAHLSPYVALVHASGVPRRTVGRPAAARGALPPRGPTTRLGRLPDFLARGASGSESPDCAARKERRRPDGGRGRRYGLGEVGPGSSGWPLARFNLKLPIDSTTEVDSDFARRDGSVAATRDAGRRGGAR